MIVLYKTTNNLKRYTFILYSVHELSLYTVKNVSDINQAHRTI